MSGKKQESTIVTERRLRPIYDCLDVGNNKTALQEAEKLLKKQPDLVCAKALRALALIRLTRISEATGLLSEIEQQDPDEEYTLQALTYCYRDLGKPESIIMLYDRAIKKHPQNEQFLSHLMMAYVRVGEYKKQNHIAMQLYKLRPSKNPYYFWSVMSTVMQAYDDPKLSRTMYLPLAQRMIEKFIQSDKLNAEAEVKLYVLILEMQEKYAEAVAVLQGDLMARFVKCMWESNQKLVQLLEKLQRWHEVYDLCRRLLPENLDDWFVWSHLFSSAFEVIKEDSTRKSSVIDELTTTVISAAEKEPSYRGPYLARMRLIACLLERDYIVRSELGEPRELLLDYFRRFGDRPSLFDDIKPYLWLLGEEQQNDFIERLEQGCGDLAVGAPSSQSCDNAFAQDLKQALKHEAGLQLARCLGRHAGLSLVDKQQLATDLVRRYEAALNYGSCDPKKLAADLVCRLFDTEEEQLTCSACWKDMSETEILPADGYLLLALYTIWDIYLDVADHQLLLEMIFLCEQGVKQSPSNFRIKSLLVKLYTLVGGGACVLRVSESMDIKYVLRDTLWYLVCDHLSPWGLYVDIVDWCRASLTFYTQSEKEIVDCVVQCYKSGSFPKILEFFDFRKKLWNSFHLRACQVWRAYFSLVNDGANMDVVVAVLKESSISDILAEGGQWSSFVNNADYTILPCCDPDDTAKAAESSRQESYQQQVDQLRYYQLVLASLSSFLDSESGVHKDDAVAPQEIDDGAINGVTESDAAGTVTTEVTFTAILNELRAHWKHCRNSYSQSPATAYPSTHLNNPISTFYGMYLAGNYADVLILALESSSAFVRKIESNGTQSNGVDSRCKGADAHGNTAGSVEIRLPSAEEVQQLLKAMFSWHQLHGSADGFPFMQICHVSFLVQTLSVVMVVISLTLRRAQNALYNRQPGTREKKQKKKKGQTAPNADVAEDPLIAEFLQFASVFCQAGETTLRLVEDLEMLLEIDISQTSLAQSRFLPLEFCTARSETATKLQNSYKHSIKELQRVMSQNLASVSAWYRGDESVKSAP